TGVNKLNKPQLISELNKRGLIDIGLIPELKNRLLKYLNGESLPTDFSVFEEHNFDPIIKVGKLNRMDSKKPYCDSGRFSGSISENIDSFLKKYNRAASINEWTNDDESQHIAACLEGSA
ncbi:jerky protein-like, partial [Aphis craccivora]